MMVNTKYDGVLKELAALLVPHLIAPLTYSGSFASIAYVDAKIDNLPLSFDPAAGLATCIEDLVKEKMDELGPIDRILVREVCEEVIDDYDIDEKVNNYMTNNFDISDWVTEIRDLADVDNVVEQHLYKNLHDEVQTAIQGLTFTVEVSTR